MAFITQLVTEDRLLAALADVKTELVKWVVGVVASQAVIVLGGVYFMISHTR